MDQKYIDEFLTPQGLGERSAAGPNDEGCLSLDGTIFVFIPSYFEFGCGKIFNYNISEDILQTPDSSYCASEFGKREGNAINFTGGTGESTSFWKQAGLYNFVDNTVTLLSNLYFSTEEQFNDVNDNTDYSNSIMWMAANGVINGYPNGNFQPDTCVNRVEMLKMLFETLGVNENNYDSALFVDTFEDEWYAPYVKAGRARGTINGYPDQTFRPAQCVNRVEAIKMAILEFNNGEIPAQSGLYANPYDVALHLKNNQGKTPEWWEQYFDSAMGAGSVGVDHFTRYNADWTPLGVASDFANPTYDFGPADSMTRKEVAEMLYRMKAMKDNSQTYFDEAIRPNNL